MEGAQPAAGRAPVTPEVTARRSRRASPVAPLVLGALILGLAILDALLGFAAHKRGFGVGLAILSVAALGLVVARRQPGNPIGWLLMGFSTGLVCYDAVAHYAVIDYHFHHGDLPLGPAAALIASELWIVFFLVLPVVILLFPDGRLTPRWRMTLWAYLAVCALITAILLGSGAWQMSGIRIVVDGKGQLVPNPGATSALAIPFIILLASVPVFWASFVVRQGLSWRRATGERRQQLKWLMAGSTLSVAGLAATFLLAQLSSPLAAALANGMLGIGLFSLPAGLSIGILKYRLYDIDRLISRTLSYTLVTGLLVGVYAGIVTLATEGGRSPRRSRWRRPPWPSPRCSIRSAAGYSGPSTAGSTAPATTPTRPWPRSRPGCRTRWTWTRSATTWPRSCSRCWNPPASRYG